MKTRDLSLNAIMVALLAVSSQITIGIQPVPISLQTFVVMLIGILLPPSHAFFTCSAYTLLGLVGVPVFSAFSGGFNSVLSASFGFILSFSISSFLQSLYLEKRPRLQTHDFFFSSFLNFLLTYSIGIPYMYIILHVFLGKEMPIKQIFMLGLLPFIPGDLLKIFLASTIGKRLYPRYRGQRKRTQQVLTRSSH